MLSTPDSTDQSEEDPERPVAGEVTPETNRLRTGLLRRRPSQAWQGGLVKARLLAGR